MGIFVNQGELGKLVGVSRNTLIAWAKAGMPYEPSKPGKRELTYDTELVIRWMVERRANPDGEIIDGPFEKARLDRERADAQALKNAVDRADLVSTEAICEAVTGAYITVRSRLLGLPTSLAPLLIGHTKLPVIERLISDELTECLIDITEEHAAAVARGTPEHTATGEADGGPVGGPEPKAKPRVKRGARKVANGKGRVPARDDGGGQRP